MERGGYEYQHLCHPLRPTARCWLLLRGSGNLAGRIVLTRAVRRGEEGGKCFRSQNQSLRYYKIRLDLYKTNSLLLYLVTDKCNF